MTLHSRWTAILVSLAVAVVLIPGAPASAAEVGPLQIINYNSGLCVEVKNASTANNATLQQNSCLRKRHQLWWFQHQPTGGYFQMVPQHMILADVPGCITNTGWSRDNGHDMKLTPCTAPPWADSSEAFSLVPGSGSALPTPGPQYRYRLINWFSQMCLEITGGSTSIGAVLQQAPCDGSARQYWIINY